jgi:hypothetical protein
MNSKLELNDYAGILEKLVQAWNRADAEAVAAFYTDDLDYRDPSMPQGIHGKKDFIDYLNLMFSVWPRQEWIPGELYPHAKDGSFSGCYRFSIGNDRSEIKGAGIDLIVFKGDKISQNHVYLNSDKWNTWLKGELGEKRSTNDQ